MIITLWKRRDFIVRNALNDLRYRFAGSALGLLWNVVTPLFQIAVFSMIFSVLLQAKLPGLAENRFSFTIYLCAGLLPWIAFSEGLSRGVNSLVANAGYLKKLNVPAQIFVAQDVATYLISGAISLSLFVIFCLIVGYPPRITWIQLAPALVLFIAFAFGLSMFLASLNVFFRDVAQAVSLLLLLWMWVTPIVYPFSLFENHAVIGRLMPFNPAFAFIEMFHKIVMDDVWLSPLAYGVPILFVVAANALGYFTLRRLAPEILDTL